ncbi:amino acid ABC transporter substrate-binding protein [Pontibacillus marinus]|uniref:Amino acid ABC transporter substrate-binding protein n=1 Tax=Pontibacillus marinus BH030004 = DSM 16465 TaxID=1385511 RepID=A0A0A5GBQ2_9BACI|nr:amino acid ABC transporter substrate-binding protein [Pontibacillus marinus]KGX89459.1 amino acid ABC transporter substrate-binding protein [Pontibacillus marinus BH030004 = DSM 16465]
MKRKWFGFLVVILSLSVMLMGCNNEESAEETSLLDTVKDRDLLIAGVNGELPGFSYLDSEGNYSGFDADFARAIAAAVLGDASKVEYRPLSSKERFTAVQTGEVDVLTRNTTWTLTRDTSVGLNFAPVTFYDGQGIIVPKDSGITSIEDLEGARISVESGTTTELNLADQMRKHGINYEAVVYDSQDAAVAAYESGSVDAYTTDKSGLVARKAIMKDPSAHVILDDTLSKEPLAPAVIGGDDKWFDVVKWVVNATIQAEELGITSENVDEFKDSSDPVVQRLLGTDGDLGSQLGLSDDFGYQVIKQVGNYGEIFERNLGPDTKFGLERGLNGLYTEGGLMYSPPLR